MSCRGPFTDVLVHTAKCSECDQRNRNTLQKCVECGEQLCRACFGRSNGLHGPPEATPAFTTFPPLAINNAAPVTPPSTHASQQSPPTQTASKPPGTLATSPADRPLSSSNAQNTPVPRVGSSSGSSTAIGESISPQDHAHGRTTLTPNPPTSRTSAPTDRSPPRRQSSRLHTRSSGPTVVHTTEASTGHPHSSSNDTPAGSTALLVDGTPYPSTRRLRPEKATAPKPVPAALAMPSSSPRDSTSDTAFLNDGPSPSTIKSRRYGRASGPKSLTAAQVQEDLHAMLPADTHKKTRSVKVSRSSNFPAHHFESPTVNQFQAQQAADSPKPQTTKLSRNIHTGSTGYSLRPRTRASPAIVVASDSGSDTDSHVYGHPILTGNRAPAATPASGTDLNTAPLTRTEPVLFVALQRLAADDSGSGPMEVDAVDQSMADVTDEQPEIPASRRRSRRSRTAVATYNLKEALGTRVHTPTKYLKDTLPGRVKRNISPLASEIAESEEQMGDVQMQGQVDGASECAEASGVGAPVEASYIEENVPSKQIKFARKKESAIPSRGHAVNRSAALSSNLSSMVSSNSSNEHPPEADSEESDQVSEFETTEVYTPVITRSGRAPGRASGLKARQAIADQAVPSRLGARNREKDDRPSGGQAREFDEFLETIKLPESWYESQKADPKPRHSALGLLDGDLRPVLRDDVHPSSQSDLPRNLRWKDIWNRGGPRNTPKKAKKMKRNVPDEFLDEPEYEFKSRAPPAPPSEPYPESRAKYKFLDAKDEQLISPSSLNHQKSNIRAKASGSARASSANMPNQAPPSGPSSTHNNTHNPPDANETKVQRDLGKLCSAFEDDEDEEMQDDANDAFYRPDRSTPPKRRRVNWRNSEERESEAANVPASPSRHQHSPLHIPVKQKPTEEIHRFDVVSASRAARGFAEAPRGPDGIPIVPGEREPTASGSRPRRVVQPARDLSGFSNVRGESGPTASDSRPRPVLGVARRFDYFPAIPGVRIVTEPVGRQGIFNAQYPQESLHGAPPANFQPVQGFANHPSGVFYPNNVPQYPIERTQAVQGSGNYPLPSPGMPNASQYPPQNHPLSPPPGYVPPGYAPPANTQQTQGFNDYPLPPGAGMAPAFQYRPHTEPPVFPQGFAPGPANAQPVYQNASAHNVPNTRNQFQEDRHDIQGRW